MKSKHHKTLRYYILRPAALETRAKTKDWALVLGVGFEWALGQVRLRQKTDRNVLGQQFWKWTWKHPSEDTILLSGCLRSKVLYKSKMLFAFFTFIHSQLNQLYNAVSQRLHAMCYNRLNAEVGMRIQLFSIKPDIRDL